MIRFHNVTLRYPEGGEALRSVNLHIPPGQMVFITGHSGAGKSTMLRLITLIERCSRGRVVVGGQNLSRIPARKIPLYRRHLGIVFQDHRLLAERTVFDNVALPLIAAAYRHGEVRRRVRAALDQVGLLGKDRLYPPVLSGGEQQRVASRAPSFTGPRCCSPTSPPGIWIPSSAMRSCDCSDASTRSGLPCSSRHTIWVSLVRCRAGSLR